MNLYRQLRHYFRFIRGIDNMPILATPRAGRGKGREALAKVMKDRDYQSGVEIGTRYGQSARIWCGSMPKLQLTCIDPWQKGSRISQAEQDKIYADARENLKLYNATLWRMPSTAALDYFADATIDFVYIDGAHDFDNVAMDIICWTKKVKKNGLILVHDYCHFRLSGVIEAVNAYTHCHRIDPWYVTRDYEPTAFWERGIEKA